MGVTQDDLLEMPWGRLVLMLQARAQSYKVDDGPREATWEEIVAWAGGSL
jgi:hypothetical protein